MTKTSDKNPGAFGFFLATVVVAISIGSLALICAFHWVLR